MECNHNEHMIGMDRTYKYQHTKTHIIQIRHKSKVHLYTWSMKQTFKSKGSCHILTVILIKTYRQGLDPAEN